MTASLTVCQSHPSSRATSLTLLALRPTCSVIHRPARSVIIRRFDAIRGSSSVQDPVGQLGSGHRNLRFRQITRIGRPPMDRSTSSTRRRSFTWATTPHEGQPCTDRVSSTCTRRAAPGTSSTSRITTLGRPTSDTHRLQIGWGLTGALHSDGVRYLQNGGPPPFIGGPQTPLTSEVPPKYVASPKANTPPSDPTSQ